MGDERCGCGGPCSGECAYGRLRAAECERDKAYALVIALVDAFDAEEARLRDELSAHGAMYEEACALHARATAEQQTEITRLRERVRELEASGRITPGDAAAAQEYVAALERDRDRINYMDGLTGEVSLIRWTGRRHGEIRGLGWVLLNEGPGVVSQDVSPTVRAAIDRARGAKP